MLRKKQLVICRIEFLQDTIVLEPAGFRQILLEAVDYGLMVLGEIVRQAIYERIEKDHGLKRADIPEQLDAFHTALGSVLGVSAKTVEKLIAKNLYQRLNLNLVAHPEWTLVEYVNHARTTLESNQIHSSYLEVEGQV